MKITKASDPLAHLQDHEYYLWDEYYARYISTLVMGDFLTDISKKDYDDFFNTVCDLLYETTSDNIDSYSGMQLLGAVSACKDINVHTTVSDKFGEEENRLLEHYRSIKSVSQIISRTRLTKS